MRFLLVLVLLLIVSPAYASVESTSSGVFRGSMLYVVTLGGEDVVSNVAAGDFIGFRFADQKYLTKTNVEDIAYL